MIVLHQNFARQDMPCGMDLFSMAGMNLDAPEGAAYEWTYEDVQNLKDDVLQKSLKQVGDARVGPETLNDIAQWVDADGTENPFSITNCIAPYAERAGMKLSDALAVTRQEFHRRLRKRGVAVGTTDARRAA